MTPSYDYDHLPIILMRRFHVVYVCDKFIEIDAIFDMHYRIIDKIYCYTN